MVINIYHVSMKLNYLYKNKKIIISIFIFTLFASIIPYLPNFQKSSIIEPISTKTEVSTTDVPNSNNSLPRQFQIEFPSSPSYSYREQLLPKLSQKPITLHQYTAKDGDVEYKVYTTVLPKKCFRWSKKNILKGALEILTQKAGLQKKILTSTFKKSEKYSILEYILRQEQGKIQTIGKLILVDTTLYLIEVSVPEINLTSDSSERIKEFIQSFELSHCSSHP